jgi:hypothetical protein
MKLSVPNFINYNPQPAGGVVTQQLPNVFVYPWVPNTPAGPGTMRTQPHESPPWFSRATRRQNFFQAKGTCSNCPNCPKKCKGGINSR